MSQHEVRVAMELTCNCLVTAFFFLITDSPAISTCLRLNSGMLHIKEDKNGNLNILDKKRRVDTAIVV